MLQIFKKNSRLRLIDSAVMTAIGGANVCGNVEVEPAKLACQKKSTCQRQFPKPLQLMISALLLWPFVSVEAQAATVVVTVNWPAYANENSLQIYDVSNTTALTPVFSSAGASSYSGSQTYTLPDNTAYILRMNDSYGDGWQGTGANVTVTSGGATLLSTTLASGSYSAAQFTTPGTGGSGGAVSCDAAANQAMALSGSATLNAVNEIILTPAQVNTAGSAWSGQMISLQEPFNLKFKVNLGTLDANGADGIAFAFHRAPNGPASVGYFGGALGVGGLDPAVAIEFDTFDNNSWGDPGFNDTTPNDHTDIHDPATYTNAAGGGAGSLLSGVIDLGNLEDGNWHTAEINWDPATTTLTYTLDGVTLTSLTRDLINTDFLGIPYVYYGFAAGTGGYYNQQSACILTAPPPVAVDFSDAPANGSTAPDGTHATAYGEATHTIV